MANVKNFGLVGVGTSVQFGKAGPSLSKDSATVLRADGTAAFVMPVGTVAQRPTGATGMLRFNDDVDQMEYYDGTGWVTLATGGATVSSFQTSLAGLTPSTSTTGAVTLAGILGGASGGTGVNNGTDTITTEGNVNFGGAVTTGGDFTLSGAFPTTITVTGSTSVTLPTSGTLLSTANIAANAVTSFQTSLQGLTPSTATNGVVTLAGTLGPLNGGTGLSSVTAGSVLYASATDVWSAAAPGSTSGVQAWDADLDALAGLTTTGYIVRTGAGTATTRSIVGTSGNIVVTNGSGVSSDTSINLDTVTQAATGDFVKVTLDTFGRVTGNTAVVAADVTALVDGIYVNVSGDTMSSAANLTFSGGGEVLGLPSTPSGNTAAASKAYVDSVAAGLTWKTAVLNATTANVTLSGEQTIDGVLTATSRILVKNQTAPAENGIYVTAAGAWTRATDSDTPSDLDGAAVFVQQGTANADTGWTQTNTIITVGTTAVNWVQFSGANAYIGGTGIDITGNTISANLGAGIGEFNTDNIGIDLFDPTTGAIILTTDGTARSTSNSAQLQLLLDGAGALAQGAGGLRVNAASVTNAMLVNNSFVTNADSGTNGSLALGGELEIAGSSIQGIATSIAGSVFTVSGIDASTTQKGVASFDTANFAVTSGAVSIKAGGVDLTTNVAGILPVPNGGTGVNTLGSGQLLIGAGTSPVVTDADLAFNTGTNTLTVGSATIQGTTSGDTTITAGGTSDINLNPGTGGAVVVGPAGAGLIQSDAANTLTISGDTGLTLRADTSGDITLDLATGTAYKVSVVGPSDADYINGLANNDLVTKYYVDTVAGNAVGDVKAVEAIVDLSATGTTNIGAAALPAGATVLSVKVNVTSADTATGTLVVGITGTPAAYMAASENDTQSTGLYLAETMVVNSGVQVIATVGGTPGGAGSATVVVTYKLA